MIALMAVGNRTLHGWRNTLRGGGRPPFIGVGDLLGRLAAALEVG